MTWLLAAGETGTGALIDGVFTAAPHNDILQVLIQITILLFTARILGELSQRLGQPSVVGEILAGIVLGPSLLSGLFPAVEQVIIPQTAEAGYLLEMVAMIGVMFLLLITGLETDVALIRRQARSALGVAVGGLGVTLSAGFLLGQVLPDDMLADPEQRFVFSLFLATSMAISAIPVVAKVLMDLGLTRRDIGQNIIASAMIDDTTGWILLSIVIGLVGGQAITVGSVASSVGIVLAFLALSFTVGQWIVARLLRFTQENIRGRDKILSLVVLLMFTWGTITHFLHIEALLGAFILGILLSRLPNLSHEVVHKLESIALGIFAPIFFAVAGLKVNIVALFEPRLMLIALIVISTAMLCKVTGVYLGARLIGGRDHWSALFLGVGLNARGSMEIIVATIGLTLGVLTQEMFSIIVVMAVTTSLIAPTLLRWTVTKIQTPEHELERLRQEELNKDNLIINAHRVLLPVRYHGPDVGNANQRVEARILERLGSKTDLAITLFNINPNGGVDSVERGKFLDEMGNLFKGQQWDRKVVNHKQPEIAILDEVDKGYDLLILGASDRNRDATTLFSPIVDHITRMTSVPAIVVHGTSMMPEDWQPKRILIPTNGSVSSKRAAQVGFAMVSSEDENCEAIILKVVEQHPNGHYLPARQAVVDKQLISSEQIVGELREIGEALGVETCGVVREGTVIDDEILRVAEEENVDLIVLGTDVRAGSDRLYMGPKIEHILNAAPCPVIVVNAG